MIYTVMADQKSIKKIADALLVGAEMEVVLALDVDLRVMIHPESMRRVGNGFKIEGTYVAPLIKKTRFIMLPREDQPDIYTFLNVVG